MRLRRSDRLAKRLRQLHCRAAGTVPRALRCVVGLVRSRWRRPMWQMARPGRSASPSCY